MVESIILGVLVVFAGCYVSYGRRKGKGGRIELPNLTLEQFLSVMTVLLVGILAQASIRQQPITLTPLPAWVGWMMLLGIAIIILLVVTRMFAKLCSVQESGKEEHKQ